jgi:hypothetical protein
VKLALSLCAAAALLFTSHAARAGACAQKNNDTGLACLKLHTEKECLAKQAKVHGKLQQICAWTVATPPAAGHHAKPGCEFCGNPSGGFYTVNDAKTGKFSAAFKESKDVDAAGQCPAGWLRFGKNDAALGDTPEKAEAAARTSDLCK